MTACIWAPYPCAYRLTRWKNGAPSDLLGFLVLLVSLLAVVAFSRFFEDIVTKPIRQLSDFAIKFGSNPGMQALIPIRSSDEVGSWRSHLSKWQSSYKCSVKA